MSHAHFKLLIFIFMAFIVYNLFRGLYFLVIGKEKGRGTARSLSWRIALSMGLFLLLILLKVFGLVEPHALNRPPNFTQPETNNQKKDDGLSLDEIQQQQNDGRIRLKQ